MKSPRFWTVVLLLAATAFILHSRGDSDRVPASEPLSLMPETIGSWTGQDLPIADDVLAVLGKGDFLNRVYTSSQPMNVSQTAAQVGRQPADRTLYRLLPDPAHRPVDPLAAELPAGRRLDLRFAPLRHHEGRQWQDLSRSANTRSAMERRDNSSSTGTRRTARSIPNEYVARAYMVADAIRMDRTDGALVRVITQIAPTETVADARRRAVRFTSLMAPMLPRFIPN